MRLARCSWLAVADSSRRQSLAYSASATPYPPQGGRPWRALSLFCLRRISRARGVAFEEVAPSGWWWPWDAPAGEGLFGPSAAGCACGVDVAGVRWGESGESGLAGGCGLLADVLGGGEEPAGADGSLRAGAGAWLPGRDSAVGAEELPGVAADLSDGLCSGWRGGHWAVGWSGVVRVARSWPWWVPWHRQRQGWVSPRRQAGVHWPLRRISRTGEWSAGSFMRGGLFLGVAAGVGGLELPDCPHL